MKGWVQPWQVSFHFGFTWCPKGEIPLSLTAFQAQDSLDIMAVQCLTGRPNYYSYGYQLLGSAQNTDQLPFGFLRAAPCLKENFQETVSD
jgi:hypothetical protein